MNKPINEIGVSKHKLHINPEYEKLVPKLTKEEYEALKQSIKENGQYVPIVCTMYDVILDGHNRYKACVELGIEIRTNRIGIFDPLEEKKFVIESNLKRRQLTDPQKIVLGMELLKLEQELANQRKTNNLKIGTKTPLAPIEAKGKSTSIVAKKIGVSTSTFERGKAVIEKANPEIKDSWAKGDLSTSKAYNLTTNPAPKDPKITKTNDEIEYEKANKDFINNAMELFYFLWCKSPTYPYGLSHHGCTENSPDSVKIDCIADNICNDLGFKNGVWIQSIAKNLYYADKKSNELEAKLHPETKAVKASKQAEKTINNLLSCMMA